MIGLVNNRGVALTVLILSVIGSIYFGAMKDFHGYHRTAQKIFENGDQNDGLSIANEIIKMKENAFDLATIGRTASGTDADTITRVTLNAEIMCEDVTFSTKIEAMEKMYNEAEKLLAQIMASDLETDYKGLADAVMYNINSRYNVIMKDPYNERVEKMNKEMTGFPGAFLKSITFSKDVEYFR